MKNKRFRVVGGRRIMGSRFGGRQGGEDFVDVTACFDFTL